MPRQFTLGRKEKLKSRKEIQRLFSEGKSFSVFPLRILYLERPCDSDNLRVAFSVSSKNFKRAVDRNRIKRLMREAYRLQKGDLKKMLEDRQQCISVFIIYTDKMLPTFGDIEKKMNNVLKKLTGIFSGNNN